MQNPPLAANTCAIIVLFYPDGGIGTRLIAIQRQVERLIVVINGIAPEIRQEISRQLDKTGSAVFIENRRNTGIATALNQGMDIALREGYTWALLFDQDTGADGDLLENLHDIVEGMEPQLALLGCNYRDANKGRTFLNCKPANAGVRERKTLITSGTLLSIAVYRRLGAFCGHYFIDSVDHEYCLRARRAGYRNFISCKPLMTHAIGLPRQDGGKAEYLFQAYIHPPARKYYIARNTWATIRSYWKSEPLWSCRQLARMALETLSVLLYEEDKMKKLTAMGRGLADGIAHRFPPGPLE